MDDLRKTHLGIPRPQPDRLTASEQLQRAYEQVADRGVAG
jgi:hypothetical protein